MSIGPRIAHTLVFGLLLVACGVAQDTTQLGRLLQSDPKLLMELVRGNSQGITRSSIADLANSDVREAPGHVQVISARQIAAVGARDLFDALQLVPGMTFVRGADDVITIAVHGNFAGEGRCLVMLNGIQLNENNYGGYALNNRISVQNIDRIEVLSGSGSTLYGGYAGLGVINIVTRTADTGQGTTILLSSGHSNGQFSRNEATVSGSHRLSRDQEINYLASTVSGPRSNALARTSDSTQLAYTDSTDTKAFSFQLGYRWRTLRAFLYYMDETSDVSNARYQLHNRDMVLGLEQRKSLTNSIELFWKLSHADQQPWNYGNTNDPERLSSNTTNSRTTAMALLNVRPTQWLSLRAGSQAFRQHTRYNTRSENAIFSMNGQDHFDVLDVAFFGELNAHGRFGSFTAGYRYEQNDLSNATSAPRLAYAKVLGRWYVKAMYSRSFRNPTVMNVNHGPLSGSLMPERITTYEGELGVDLMKGSRFSVNVFQTRIDDAIMLVRSVGSFDGYANAGSTGSEGIDARFSFDNEKISLLASAGINRPLSGVTLANVDLPDTVVHGRYGLPGLRGSLSFAWDLTGHLTLRGSGTWQASVYSNDPDAANKEGNDLIEWPAQLIVNTGIAIHPGKARRLSLDLGCRNVLDEDRVILPPSASDLRPYQMSGRELTFAITYKFIQ